MLSRQDTYMMSTVQLDTGANALSNVSERHLIDVILKNYVRRLKDIF